MSSRETILKRLKEAAAVPSELSPTPVGLDDRIRESLKSITPGDSISLSSQFQKELELVSGEFYQIRKIDDAVPIISRILDENPYNSLAVTGKKACQEITSRIEKKHASIRIVRSLEIPYPERKNLLAHVPAALVHASFAIADIGSLVFPYDDTGTSLPHFLAECVIALVDKKNLLANQFELVQRLSPDKAKNMVLVTGPSRTADIEKVLILGAHGPKRFIVIMIN